MTQVYSNLLGDWRRRIAYLRFRPFPSDTASNRAAERMRRIALSTLASVAGRLLSAVTTLMTVPLTISYLGSERYGLWLTVSSTLAVLSFADLGIGNGLVTKISEAYGRDDALTIRRLASSAVLMLSAIAVVLAGAVAIATTSVDWAMLLNVQTPLACREVPQVVFVFGMVTVVGMPFAVVSKVQGGLQDGFGAAIWTMIGTALSLVALVAVTWLRLGLVWLVLALAGTPVLTIMVNFAWYFAHNHAYRPSWGHARLKDAAQLLQMGILFLLLQISIAFAFLSDNLIVANRLGSAAVPSLAVPAKLFSLVLLPISLIIAPLWPAYGEAQARGDYEWIARTLRRSSCSSVIIAAALSAMLLPMAAPLVRVWSRGVVVPDLALLIPLALWTGLSAWGQSIAVFLNGSARILGQTICGTLMALTAFTLKWFLVGRIGLPGVVWATVVSYAVFVAGPIWIFARSQLNQNASGRGQQAQPEPLERY